VFDHHLGRVWMISTGLLPDGSRSDRRARERIESWQGLLSSSPSPTSAGPRAGIQAAADFSRTPPQSNLSEREFILKVERAQRYIRSGDIYQVNLSHRLAAACNGSGWDLFGRLRDASPAPFAAYIDCGDFELVSSSPEQFLKLSGSSICTRPIKGTRPRGEDATRDAQLAYELQTSPKELAELVMITDLLRNDLGRVCDYGSVQVPELARLERFAQVQHLVSTVEGQLRRRLTHFEALASCFPGGSITGAPKFRAMEIIDELEPVARGPYTGCHGYLGFNRESQLSISIRTAIWKEAIAYFHVGAGIVADSVPQAEYEETIAKAQGFIAALEPLQRKTVATILSSRRRVGCR
jgi:para-aminobenzoate synthetase component I